MAAEGTERHAWAAARIAADPAARVLEVGCGHGVTATLVAANLEDGRLTAIDRSAKMIALAERRNAALVADGRAEFIAVAIDDFAGAPGAFDVVYAMNVAAFWRPGDGATAKARRLLRPGGVLHLLADWPPWKAPGDRAAFAERLAGVLVDHGFDVAPPAAGDAGAPVVHVAGVARPG